MTPSLKNFREIFLDKLLIILWSQWTSLGVASTAPSETESIIDLEALLFFTCSLGRYDARLFDEALNWLYTHGRFINIQRMKTIMKKEAFSGDIVLAAISRIMSRQASMRKWKAFKGKPPESPSVESLFFTPDGKPMPHFGEPDEDFAAYGLLRGKCAIEKQSRPVRISTMNIIYQLRALMGTSARCETIAYLLTHEGAHPSQIARDTYYYQKTIQDTLVDMACSGLVSVESKGREKLYHLRSDEWNAFLTVGPVKPPWLNWPPLFRAYERIWLMIKEDKLLTLTPLLQASELRKLMYDVRPSIQKAALGHMLSDHSRYPGAAYTKVLISDLMRLLENSV